MLYFVFFIYNYLYSSNSIIVSFIFIDFYHSKLYYPPHYSNLEVNGVNLTAKSVFLVIFPF